jgi:3-oxoacyl-[acyl-carrier-protein] synthase-3
VAASAQPAPSSSPPALQLTRPPGAAGARIVGLGDYRPTRVVTNEELSRRLDTDDQWIRERTGIAERRIAESETVADMATEAAAKALADSGLAAGEIDLIVAATCSAENRLPGIAAVVAGRLGMPAPGAYDLNAACAGFCYALANAADAIRAGNARRVLVIGVEKLSDITDWDDRSTCIIFADGAGAAVVEASDSPGIGPVAWGSDGARSDTITCLADDPYLRMEGPAVFRWATTSLTAVGRRACELAGITTRDLDALVLHQANLRIMDSLARSLGVRDKVLARDIVEAGNASAASIPMAMTRMRNSGEIASGDLALLLAFGAGLTYAGQVVRIP